MIKRAFVISDTHFGAKNNSIELLNIMKNYFYDEFIPLVKKNYKKGDILIHAGDIFDNRQSINLLVLHEVTILFEQLKDIFVDGIYLITGNHDIMKKTSNDISSLDSLKYIPNINIIKDPTILKVKNNDILLLPWQNELTVKGTITSYLNKCTYIFAHCNVMSINYDKYRKNDNELGIEINDVLNFEKLYIGHIHYSQNTNNVTIIGNPYEMTRSDGDNKKGCYLVDFETKTDEFFENKYSPKFKKIYVNHILDYKLGDIKNICTNNNVDLYIPSEYILKYDITTLVDELSKVSNKLEVIPFELYQNEYDIDSDSYNESLNILNLCSNYIKQMKTEDTIKDRLTLKIKSIYSEILNNSIGEE